MFRKVIEAEVRQLQAQWALNLTKEFTTKLTNKLENLVMLQLLPKAIKDKAVAAYVNPKNNVNIWGAAVVLGEYLNTVSPDSFPNPDFYTHLKNDINALITEIRETMGLSAKYKSLSENTSDHGQTVVEFGTSGWRGRIGDDFTVYNVHKVTRAIIDMMHSDEFLIENSYRSFAEVQKHGIAVFRDNRFMGEEFIQASIKELTAAGIKVYYAGECATGIGSKLVTQLKAAGSINFTPSHNPMDGAGLKFNPADGGPAGPNLTNIIQAKANVYMADTTFMSANGTFINNVLKVDAIRRYVNYLKKSPLFNLNDMRQQLLAQANNIELVVDNMHGASRGVVEAIFGKEVIKKLNVTFLNTGDDLSFHGAKPEPSAKNQKPLIDRLQNSSKKIRIAVAFDPDADRIRFADQYLDIDMNMFSSIAFGQLIDQGYQNYVAQTHPATDSTVLPGVATTVASSGFAAGIARANNMSVFEVAVGFKNFREPLTLGQVIMAFEESDGFSVFGHTLEKDGFAAFLIALKAVLATGKNVSEIYTDLGEKYGYYFPNKGGKDVPGLSLTEWQGFRKDVLDTLKKQFQVGNTVTVGNKTQTIASINTADGLKLTFADHSWMLLRSSGTEAKFRYYIEVTGKENADQVHVYLSSADQILGGAIAAVEEAKKAATTKVTGATETSEDKRAREGEIVGDKGNKSNA